METQLQRSLTKVGLRLESLSSVLLPVTRLAIHHPVARGLLAKWRVACAASFVTILCLWRRIVSASARRSLAMYQSIVAASPQYDEGDEGHNRGGTDGATTIAHGSISATQLICCGSGRIPPGLLRELAYAVSVGLVNSLMTMQKVKLIGSFSWAVTNGDRTFWLRSMLIYPPLMLALSGLQEALTLCKRRLSLEWRRTMTYAFHSKYFANMAYYRLLNDERFKINDPDIRIVKDIESLCKMYSEIAVSFSTSCIMTLVYGASGRLPGRHWSWALVGPVFVLLYQPTSQMLQACAGTNRDWAHGYAARAEAKYEQELTRIQLHGERICMLQGESFEREVLLRRLDATKYWNLERIEAQRCSEFGEKVLSGSGAYGLFSLVCYFSAALMCANQLHRAGGAAEHGNLHPSIPSLHAAQNFGEWYGDSWYILSIIMQWGGLFMTLTGVGGMQASSHRIAELFHKLHAIEEAQYADAEQFGHTFVDEGQLIAFRDVTVQTPSQTVLLEKLTFGVGPGQTLLISGHNGAGKSSIVRCLCSLWSIPKGIIARPGGIVRAEEDITLLKQAYYLPQKPISVLGSLSDLLTYPLTPPGGLPEIDVRRWLRYVEMEYVVDRYSSLTQHQDWDDVLSLGELQAISFARLFFHRPRFALLDECTSAVSRQLERSFFELCRILGITCITIAHRPILEDYHCRILRLTGTLAEDGCGWKLEDLPNCEALEQQARPWCDQAGDAHGIVVTHLNKSQVAATVVEQGSGSCGQSLGSKTTDITAVPSATKVEDLVLKRWPWSIQRVIAVITLGLKDANAEARWRIGLQFAKIIFSIGIECFLSWEAWVAIMSLCRSALTGSYSGVCAEALSSLILIPTIAMNSSKQDLLRRQLTQTLSISANSRLLQRALQGNSFLRLSRHHHPHGPHIENPMNRIAEMNHLLPDLVDRIFKILKTYLQGLWMLPAFAAGGGLISFLGLGISTGLNLLTLCFAPDSRSYTQKAHTLQSRFQVLHTRLRHIAEAVAFSHGGGAERSIIESQFDEAIAHQKMILHKEFMFSWLSSIFRSYDMIPMIVQRSIAFNFNQRNNPAYQNPKLGVAPSLAVITLLYERIATQVHAMFSESAQFAEQWPSLDSRMVRLLELEAALELPDLAPTAHGNRLGTLPQTSAAMPSPDAHIKVCNLDLVTPHGICLAKGIQFDLHQGRPVLVTGPNASGKTLLSCCLLGILPAAGEGARIEFPGHAFLPALTRPPLSTFMTASQRVYLPSGSLGDQVCYPHPFVKQAGEDDGSVEKAMLRAVRAAGIEYVFGREKDGWTARRNWENVLSGGEQQRMCLARLFFHRPKFALLDECTYMVAASAERGLYETLVRDFDITPITLTQRLFLPELHPIELRLGAPTAEGWTLMDTGVA